MSAFGTSSNLFGPNSTTNNATGSNPSPFGLNSTGTSNVFGNLSGGNTSGAGLFGTTPSTGAGAGQTTGGSLFGNPKPTGTSSLFGTATNTTPGAGAAATPSPFGGNNNANIGSNPNPLFGGATAGSNNPSATPSFFGGANTNTSANTNPLFGGGATGSTNNTGNAGAAGNQPAASSNPFGGGLFGTKPAEPAGGVAKPAPSNFFGPPLTTSGATPAAGGSLFGPPKAATPTPAAPVAAAPSLGAFSLGGAAAPAKSPAPAAGTTPAPGGLFGNFGSKPEEKKDGAAATTATPSPFGSSTTPANTTTQASGTSTTGGTSCSYITIFLRMVLMGYLALFGGLGSTAAPKTDATNASSAPAPATTSTAISVPPPSMLRGKSIEEIVNKWSIELETHVRDLTKFSSEVAVWDRALIENGNHLAALYSHVLAAEREQNDIDQTLDHVEQQQKELGATLEAYEKQMGDILGGRGGTGTLRGLDTGPADTERDKNYILATELHNQLDDLSSSLTQLIDSVNSVSLTTDDKGAAGEDAMAQIAQVLSSHLESLQWIDGASRELEGKVSEVEKRVRDAGVGYNGTAPGNGGRSKGFGLR
ncbi:Nsp1-like C-terminal region-domain-containing protein [Amylostereum chailletii]|nr:Nsp1-like C-terminal region-domain-containing protein [Amylostereum chailletii]